MQSLLAILLVITAAPEGCNWYQHQVVLDAVQMDSKGKDCCCTNTVTKNRKAKPVIFIWSFAEGKNQTRGKYLSKLLKLHSKLWQLHNTTPYPQTWTSDKVTTPNNFLKKQNSIMMHQIAFFFFWEREFQINMSSVPMKYGLYNLAFDFKDRRKWVGKKETPK